MANEISQKGLGNLAFQDIQKSTININQQLGKSAEYQDLITQRDNLRDFLSYIPEDEIQKRLQISKQINDFDNLIQNFKRDVLKLAETFSQIEINTERLFQAKNLFDTGKVKEVREILEADIEKIQEEHLYLISQRERYQNEILPKLKKISDEFLILALSKQYDYIDTDWFVNTCSYFDKSLEAFLTRQNVIEYAIFVHLHNDFDKAETYYKKFLKEFSATTDLFQKAQILNNLGILYQDKNDNKKALKQFEEVLSIYRELALKNRSKYLPYVAMALNNLGVLQKSRNEFGKAFRSQNEALKIYQEVTIEISTTYLSEKARTLANLGNLHIEKQKYEEALDEFKEALEIYEKLTVENPIPHFLSEKAIILNGLGVVLIKEGRKRDALEALKDALKIIQGLANDNPFMYLPHLPHLLNNLGNINAELGEYDDALNCYEIGLGIAFNLLRENPKSYLKEVAQLQLSLGVFFQKCTDNRDFSIDFLIDTVVALLPIIEKVPYEKKYLQTATYSLRDLELNKEDVEKYFARKLQNGGKIENEQIIKRALEEYFTQSLWKERAKLKQLIQRLLNRFHADHTSSQ